MIDNAFVKTAAGIAVTLSLLAGCSANKPADDAASSAAGAGYEGYGEGGTEVRPADERYGVDSEAMEGLGGYDGQPGYGAAGADELLDSLDHIYFFDFDTSELSADVRAQLDATAAALRQRQGIVRLEGHADERGTREYNLALGERRANAVASYLAVLGVSRAQMEIVSYGEEKPRAPGSDELAWSENRRVELLYLD